MIRATRASASGLLALLVLASTVALAPTPAAAAPARIEQALRQSSISNSPGKAILDYNQGLMLADYTLLYAATHSRWNLAQAEQIANQSYHVFGDLTGQAPVYGAIYLRELRLLVRYAPSYWAMWHSQRTGFLAWVRAHRVPGTVHRYRDGLYYDSRSWWPYAWLWQTDELVAAQQDHGFGNAVRVLDYYWNGHAWQSGVKLLRGRIVPFGDTYYDDDDWAALDYLSGYQDALAAARAARQRWIRHRFYSLAADDLAHVRIAFRFLASGWTPWGGVWWGCFNWNRDITTVSTAGSAQVALELYLAVHKVWYLWWARRAIRWENRMMRAADGLYYDRRTVRGCRTALPCWPAGFPYGAGGGGNQAHDPMLWLASLES
jgi:hypothetical protein